MLLKLHGKNIQPVLILQTWHAYELEVINDFVKQCSECQRTFIPPREPLIMSPLPQHPWEKVSSDLFHFNSHTYLIMVAPDILLHEIFLY